MKYREEVLPIALAQPSGRSQLMGILARPQVPAGLAVVVLVGGPQYRVGSHRQFVLLARALAAAGYAVLRFDFAGMGDSAGAPCDFEHTGQDIAAAINALLQAVPEVREVALWGLCDGASAALLYCHATADARVTALCLANPWVRSEASLARTHVQHYYLQRLLQRGFWHKLLQGHMRIASLLELLHTLRRVLTASPTAPQPASFQQRMARAWAAFPGRILLLLSGDDFTAKEFVQHATHDAAWHGALQHPRLLRHDLPGADHTFSSARLREQVAWLTLQHGLQHGMQSGLQDQSTSARMRKRGRPPQAT